MKGCISEAILDMNLSRKLLVLKHENFKGFPVLKQVENLRFKVIIAISKLNVLGFTFGDSRFTKTILHINNCLPHQKKFGTKKIMFVYINKNP